MDLERMRALLAALQEARYAGVRSVSYDGKTITYGSDAELAERHQRSGNPDCHRHLRHPASSALGHRGLEGAVIHGL